MDGPAKRHHDVDRDDDEPQGQLLMLCRHDPQEGYGERNLAPASGEDGAKAREVGNEQDDVEVGGVDLRVVLAVAKAGDGGEERARCRKSELTF